MLKEWRKISLTPENSINDALKSLDQSGAQIVLIVNSREELLGVVTDGDIRKAILANMNLGESVESIANHKPVCISEKNLNKDTLRRVFAMHRVSGMPVLDQDNRIVGLASLEDFVSEPANDNYIVIMAGGMGTRLGELTKDKPKPLVDIGGKPILETIILKCKNQGFYNFVISLNYKGEMIKEYFGTGSKFGVNITYVREKEKLGTAGALSLLPPMKEKLVVMNADLLTGVDINALLYFHSESNALATMCVKEFEVSVPYGVVEAKGDTLTALKEKPTYKFLVNAGIYVIEPDCLELVPEEQTYSMTDLFEAMLARKMKTSAFPIHEYWLDVGRSQDLRKAREDFGEIINEE